MDEMEITFRINIHIVTKNVEQAGAELCQAHFKLELGGFYIARYFALIGVGC